MTFNRYWKSLAQVTNVYHIEHTKKKNLCDAYMNQWIIIKSFIFRKDYENILSRECYMLVKVFTCIYQFSLILYAPVIFLFKCEF